MQIIQQLPKHNVLSVISKNSKFEIGSSADKKPSCR